MQMRTASAISTGLHVAVLLWATLSFTGETFQVTPAQSLPVDLISEKDFSQMTKGIKQAPKLVEKPKPLVEKKADEVKPVEDLKPKVAAKKEIKPAAEKVPEPQPQPKPDPIAQKLKQQPDQKQAKAQPTPLPPKRPPLRKQPKFDADKIAALLDKREPMRTLATGVEANAAPMVGTALGNAAQLSQSELDALRARLMALWNPPVGIQNPQDYVIRIRIRLDHSGRLTAPPVVLTSGKGQLFETARDSAVRAVFRGQPFDMLKPEHYDVWKDIEVTFDPRDMFRG
jgi:outer membrane biosynthesis protein TonB